MHKIKFHKLGSSFMHYGTKGQVHGVRNYQNPDGSLTPLGREHYGVGEGRKKNYWDEDPDSDAYYSNRQKWREKRYEEWKKEHAAAIKKVSDGANEYRNLDANTRKRVDSNSEKISRKLAKKYNPYRRMDLHSPEDWQIDWYNKALEKTGNNSVAYKTSVLTREKVFKGM